MFLETFPTPAFLVGIIINIHSSTVYSIIVIEIGITLVFRWSRSKAEDYLSFYTGLSQEKIELEVDRYIGRPGRVS